MKNDEVLISLWKETRRTINHLDKMMDSVRARVLTLFGTITSVAAALFFWAPNVDLFGIRLSALVELTAILAIIPLMVQNRLYHFWLFKAMNTSLDLENLISSKLQKEDQTMQIMVTHSLAGFEERKDSYLKAMWNSKLFKVEMAIFIFLVLACAIIFYIFLASSPPV